MPRLAILANLQPAVVVVGSGSGGGMRRKLLEELAAELADREERFYVFTVLLAAGDVTEQEYAALAA